ncbi:MAG: imidazoleglycerol-phosphate dehydratase HisB [Lactobacillales bacterium]|jgi:imidazoleglycerol-phosphate dehydratase|nr:imidazoleglycerol-phosphate dehydratase HisB [Lactobacillales bacterium]
MRTAELSRVTGETDIQIKVNLDDAQKVEVDTGVGFFDHMLILLARHARISLTVKAVGDIHVDGHHTVEDVGIALGQVLREALGDKVGIERYGSAILPMDETLALVAIDLSGRAYLVFNAEFENPRLGDFDTELVEEFFVALTNNLAANVHLNVLYGKNSHHKAEALFKGFGRSLREAITINPEITGVNSTKGVL